MRILMVILSLMLAAQTAHAQRVNLTAISAGMALPTATTSLTFTAADAANKNSLTMTGDSNDLLIVRNSGAGTRYVTVTSVADPRTGRTGDQTYYIGAGLSIILGPFPIDGWRQTSDGKLYFEGEHAEILFAHVRIR